MRATAYQASVVVSGYVLVVDVLEKDEPEYYVTGDRQSYAAMLCAHTGRPDVLQVHSRRMEAHHTVGKATPTPIVAEDFGTMAGYYFAGDVILGLGDDE